MPQTNTDADFWWVRYFCGVALPLVFLVCGIYSMISLHSYTIWGGRGQGGLRFVPVSGEQAILMGAAYMGLALAFFANCYAQYHERMGYYYQWLLVPGILLAGGGMMWCSLFFLFH